MKNPLESIRARYAELLKMLQSPEILSDPEKLRQVSREQAELAPILKLADELEVVERNIAEAQGILDESTDPEMRSFAETELTAMQARQADLSTKLNGLLNPTNPEDQGDAIVEIRAAAGGDEAGLFAGDLYRMYLRFAERTGWKTEPLSESSGGIGNVKEVIFKVSGAGAYGNFKFESGVHRVQRIPKTESSGRIHTSTATVVVLPVIEPKNFELNPADIEFEAFRASGAGGQNVNKVNSAVRLRHKPSGLVVTAQSERSQLQNREQAMEILRSRLWERQRAAEAANISSTRKGQIGTGDRSEKIRTYNFPQDRLTDHRVGRSYHNLPAILDGDLTQILNDLKTHETQEHLETPA